MPSADRPATRLATRLAFLVAGFGLACWAPLVPLAKQRLMIDDGILGLLLLCLGIGSVGAMLLTGALSARYGSKPMIIVGGLGVAVLLPLLSIASSPLTLGLSLLAFGAALGSLEVAMNIHAVEVERAAGRPLMSGFHALFSIGGFAGSACDDLLAVAAPRSAREHVDLFGSDADRDTRDLAASASIGAGASRTAVRAAARNGVVTCCAGGDHLPC